jgi:hypothetical protein
MSRKSLSLSYWNKAFIVAALFSMPVITGMCPQDINDPDLWWHLKTGEWILDNGSVPTKDPFTWNMSNNTWIAYSWLFEVIIFKLFYHFGLTGVLHFKALMTVLIGFSIYCFTRTLRPRIAESAALAGMAMFAMVPLMRPRPWLFSILFIILELHLLFYVRRKKKKYYLLMLLPLFCLWANLHIQFIYGLAVLLLFCIDILISAWYLEKKTTSLDPMFTALILLLSIGSTLVNPYHVRLYEVVLDTINQSGFYKLIDEMQALTFRSMFDWAVLGLAFAAVYSLRSRRMDLLFILPLFIMSCFVSFRSFRDLWLVVIVSMTVIASSSKVSLTQENLDPLRRSVVMLLLLMTFGVTLRAQNVSDSHLNRIIRNEYPVEAVEFLRANNFQGLLFNHFDWGGYLIWQLPSMKVSIDGRGNVHGDKRVEKSLQVWSGKPGWDTDSDLLKSKIIISQADQPLCSLLLLDERFRLLYQDDLAKIFERKSN